MAFVLTPIEETINNANTESIYQYVTGRSSLRRQTKEQQELQLTERKTPCNTPNVNATSEGEATNAGEKAQCQRSYHLMLPSFHHLKVTGFETAFYISYYKIQI